MRPMTAARPLGRAFARRHRAARAALALVALATTVACGGEDAPPAPTPVARPRPTSRPSILLVDLVGARLDDVAPKAGEPDAKAFARFLGEGSRFLQATAPTARSVASLASILTGYAPSETNMGGVEGRSSVELVGSFDTLAEVLVREGYDAAAFVACAPVAAAPGLEQGFGRAWNGAPTAADAAAAAGRWVATRPAGTPWFAFVVLDARGDKPADAAEAAVAAHRDAVRRADDALASLLAAAPPTADRLTFVLSDHGEGLGERGPGSVGSAAFLTDERIHVPFSAAGPGFPRASVAASVGLVDLVPTVRERMGLPPAPDLAGRPLARAIANPDAPGVPAFAQEWRPHPTDRATVERLFAVRTASRKLVAVFTPRPPSWTESVYDLAADPGETAPLPASAAEEGDAGFRAAVQMLRDLLAGRRKHLSDEMLQGYMGYGAAPGGR